MNNHNREFLVLYTHQKTKKAKTWQDGKLKVGSEGLGLGCQVTLYNETGNRLDSFHVKKHLLHVGEELESDKYLVQLEEEKCGRPEVEAPGRVSTSSKSLHLRPSLSSGLKVGLKRKSGFVPPRQIKQVKIEAEKHTDVESITSAVGFSSTIVPLSLNSFAKTPVSLFSLCGQNQQNTDTLKITSKVTNNNCGELSSSVHCKDAFSKRPFQSIYPSELDSNRENTTSIETEITECVNRPIPNLSEKPSLPVLHSSNHSLENACCGDNNTSQWNSVELENSDKPTDETHMPRYAQDKFDSTNHDKKSEISNQTLVESFPLLQTDMYMPHICSGPHSNPGPGIIPGRGSVGAVTNNEGNVSKRSASQILTLINTRSRQKSPPSFMGQQGNDSVCGNEGQHLYECGGQPKNVRTTFTESKPGSSPTRLTGGVWPGQPNPLSQEIEHCKNTLSESPVTGCISNTCSNILNSDLVTNEENLPLTAGTTLLSVPDMLNSHSRPNSSVHQINGMQMPSTQSITHFHTAVSPMEEKIRSPGQDNLCSDWGKLASEEPYFEINFSPVSCGSVGDCEENSGDGLKSEKKNTEIKDAEIGTSMSPCQSRNSNTTKQPIVEASLCINTISRRSKPKECQVVYSEMNDTVGNECSAIQASPSPCPNPSIEPLGSLNNNRDCWPVGQRSPPLPEEVTIKQSNMLQDKSKAMTPRTSPGINGVSQEDLDILVSQPSLASDGKQNCGKQSPHKSNANTNSVNSAFEAFSLEHGSIVGLGSWDTPQPSNECSSELAVSKDFPMHQTGNTSESETSFQTSRCANTDIKHCEKSPPGASSICDSESKLSVPNMCTGHENQTHGSIPHEIQGNEHGFANNDCMNPTGDGEFTNSGQIGHSYNSGSPSLSRVSDSQDSTTSTLSGLASGRNGLEALNFSPEIPFQGTWSNKIAQKTKTCPRSNHSNFQVLMENRIMEETHDKLGLMLDSKLKQSFKLCSSSDNEIHCWANTHNGNEALPTIVSKPINEGTECLHNITRTNLQLSNRCNKSFNQETDINNQVFSKTKVNAVENINFQSSNLACCNKKLKDSTPQDIHLHYDSPDESSCSFLVDDTTCVGQNLTVSSDVLDGHKPPTHHHDHKRLPESTKMVQFLPEIYRSPSDPEIFVKHDSNKFVTSCQPNCLPATRRMFSSSHGASPLQSDIKYGASTSGQGQNMTGNLKVNLRQEETVFGRTLTPLGTNQHELLLTTADLPHPSTLISDDLQEKTCNKTRTVNKASNDIIAVASAKLDGYTLKGTRASAPAIRGQKPHKPDYTAVYSSYGLSGVHEPPITPEFPPSITPETSLYFADHTAGKTNFEHDVKFMTTLQDMSEMCSQSSTTAAQEVPLVINDERLSQISEHQVPICSSYIAYKDVLKSPLQQKKSGARIRKPVKCKPYGDAVTHNSYSDCENVLHIVDSDGQTVECENKHVWAPNKNASDAELEENKDNVWVGTNAPEIGERLTSTCMSEESWQSWSMCIKHTEKKSASHDENVSVLRPVNRNETFDVKSRHLPKCGDTLKLLSFNLAKLTEDPTYHMNSDLEADKAAVPDEWVSDEEFDDQGMLSDSQILTWMSNQENIESNQPKKGNFREPKVVNTVSEDRHYQSSLQSPFNENSIRADLNSSSLSQSGGFLCISKDPGSKIGQEFQGTPNGNKQNDVGLTPCMTQSELFYDTDDSYTTSNYTLRINTPDTLTANSKPSEKTNVRKGFQPPRQTGTDLSVCKDPIVRESNQLSTTMTTASSSGVTEIGISLYSDLQFLSRDTVLEKITPLRQTIIPATFPNQASYCQTFISALKEHLNIILYDLSKSYHEAMRKADTTKYIPAETGHCRPDIVTAHKPSKNPVCSHGVPSKMVQVKKEGPNKGRYFYTCSEQRAQQCKFFIWADSVNKNSSDVKNGSTTVNMLELSDSDSITTFLKGSGISFYCETQLLKKTKSKYNSDRLRKFPPWVRKKIECEADTGRKSLFLKLPRKEKSSEYARDDLWIISQFLDFHPCSTFLGKSSFFGPTAVNEVEIEPLTGYSPSVWPNYVVCHAIHAGNASAELSCIANLQENINPTQLPILPHILNNSEGRASDLKRFASPAWQRKKLFHAPWNLVEDMAEEHVKQYSLNIDQARALRQVATMFRTEQDTVQPVSLIHGVFGAGKSYLLAVMVLFMVQVFQVNESYTPGVPQPLKLLVSSTTNVAVDRILLGLLEMGFEDFVRVGSIKKIAKPVLPYSVHAAGSDSQELKDLQEMLKSDLHPSEKVHVRRSIEQHKKGINKKKLTDVHVVGVTCAACAFQCLKDTSFPVVLLDECSQMTEPVSLLPVARFGCHRLVLVGDPKQLDPTIQGSEASHKEGLEQTLFNRLIKMGHRAVLLRTQYRCHPVISAISNQLFYHGQLLDGVKTQDRSGLVPDLPALCFFDVPEGQECCGAGGSFFNDKEADFIADLIDMFIEKGIEPASVGVITLYKAQMAAVKQRLTRKSELKIIQVSTVDAFQGGERNIIILSCVRTHQVGFIDSDKRTNVALTRAKYHLCIVGHRRNLVKNHLWGRVLHHCQDIPGGIRNGKNFIRSVKETNKCPLPRECLGRNETNMEIPQNTKEILSESCDTDGPDGKKGCGKLVCSHDRMKSMEKSGRATKRMRLSSLIKEDIFDEDSSQNSTDDDLPTYL